MFLKCALAYLIRLIRKPRKAWSVSAWVPDLLSNACLFRKDTVQRRREGKKGRNPKVKMRGVVPSAARRNRRANAVMTAAGKPCLVLHPCCFWLPCAEIRKKISSVRRQSVMRHKARLCLPSEDFLSWTERSKVLVPAQLPNLVRVERIEMSSTVVSRYFCSPHMR